MITYSDLKKGDILKVTDAIENGPKKGELVRVIEGFRDTVKVEDEKGAYEYELTGPQHAEALEVTGINGEFPGETQDRLAKEAKAQKQIAEQKIKESKEAAKEAAKE